MSKRIRMTAEELAQNIIDNMTGDWDVSIGLAEAFRCETLEAARARVRAWYKKQGFVFDKKTMYSLEDVILHDEQV